METPSYYAILTANVRYDKRLSEFQKLLYAEISALSNKEGCCWATNSYFARLYDKTETWVSISVKKLENCGYVTVFIDNKKGNKRYISLVEKDNLPGKLNLISSLNKLKDTSLNKVKTTSLRAVNDQYNNININNTSNNNNPYIPKEGCVHDFSHDENHTDQLNSHDEQCNWGEFEQIWAAYPRAERHMACLNLYQNLKFQKLVPPVNEILTIIEKQKMGWLDPKFTPTLYRWLSDHRWKDKDCPINEQNDKFTTEDQYRKLIEKKASEDEIRAFCKKNNVFVEYWFTKEEIAAWTE